MGGTWSRCARPFRTACRARRMRPTSSCSMRQKNYAETKVEETRGWNPQQGAMIYWNPEQPSRQFFFNDRDPKTGKVFTALYDIVDQETREGVPLRRDAGRQRRRQAGWRGIRGHQLRAHGAAAAGDGLSRHVGLDRRRESSAGRRAVRRRCEDGRAEADRLVPPDAGCAHRKVSRTSTTERCF